MINQNTHTTSGKGKPGFYQKKCDKVIRPDILSIALFRLGERCDNNCLMCVNHGKSSLSGGELLHRADFLHQQGITRVVLTGGEPTRHPSFWTLADHLVSLKITWDLNTNGRSFQNIHTAVKAAQKGLRRVIVSFHSHQPEIMEYISGAPGSFPETVHGIENLASSGVRVMLNCVINTFNKNDLINHLESCLNRFGPNCSVKYVFPGRSGKGLNWDGIKIQYKDIKRELIELHMYSKQSGINIFFESIPNCIINDSTIYNLGRTGFGETHYLEDFEGRSLISMRYLDSINSIYTDFCFKCSAIDKCCGITRDYLYRYGITEFMPL